MPKFLLKFNAAVIKEVPLTKETLSVGRKADNDVVIDNPAISGHHCCVKKQGDLYFVEDLESTNGTYVNEKRIKKAGLHHNDVIGLAKHALVFLEENPAVSDGALPAGKDPDATVMMSPDKQAELVAAATASAKGPNKTGVLRVLKGVVGEPEYELKGMSTYIGNSDRVQIRIKGGGFFSSTPEVAASVHRKPEGYVLVAVTQGYPIVNGQKVAASIVLKEGDLIECGGTTMQFTLKEGPAA